MNEKILDKMYIDRGEKSIGKIISQKEEEIRNRIENKLKEKYDGDELFNILEDISAVCNISTEAYYKAGVVDGFKLNEEINDIYIELKDLLL